MSRNQVFAQVSGLREIRKQLLKSDKTISPEIRKVLKDTAEIAASDARARVPTGPALGGHIKNTIKAGTSGPNAVVRAGKKTMPYYGWLDFGGTIRPRGVPIYRRIIKTPDDRWNGRYIYPAMRDNLGKAIDFLNKEITKIIDRSISK